MKVSSRKKFLFKLKYSKQAYFMHLGRRLKQLDNILATNPLNASANAQYKFIKLLVTK